MQNAGIGVLKGVSMELCGMECIDLTKNSVKNLGIHFSYNKKIEDEQSFIKAIKKLEDVLKISKVIHLALITNVPQAIIDQLNKIQKDFI